METFPTNFNDALTRIELRGERLRLARSAHTEIRQVLEVSSQLKQWGVQTVLIGSYARETAIYSGKDVDVFCKLTALDVSASPLQIFNAVHQVLLTRYGSTRVEPNRRSVKVKFEFTEEDEKFAVDVVPAVKWENRWGIPATDRTLWEVQEPLRRWIETDPEKLTELTNVRNRRPEINGRGAYVPLVKLIKQIREHHLGENKPGGLYCELLTYWAFEGGRRESSFAELLTAVLSSAAQQMQRTISQPLQDPVLNRPYEPRPSNGELVKASAVLGELAKDASQALTLSRCPAAAKWRRIIGKNDRGWCFLLPDGCDETGKEIGPIVAVRSRGSEEAHGFA